jgi:hypothetical protein
VAIGNILTVGTVMRAWEWVDWVDWGSWEYDDVGLPVAATDRVATVGSTHSPIICTRSGVNL